MRVLELRSNGFRSLKDIVWEPGDLNVLIGANAAGKSNLLRLLELIAISAKGRMGKYIQEAGGMEPLVWDGSANGIHFSLKSSPIEKQRSVERDSLTYKMDLMRVGRVLSGQSV